MPDQPKGPQLITKHKLTNPVEGEPSDCLCGRHFEAVTLVAWKVHLFSNGTPIVCTDESDD